MKSIFGFIDPGQIMGVVVALIILSVGIFAFFVTIDSAQDSLATTSDNAAGKAAINNTSGTANSVFNIIGIVLIIGAIMAIVGLVYQYVR